MRKMKGSDFFRSRALSRALTSDYHTISPFYLNLMIMLGLKEIL